LAKLIDYIRKEERAEVKRLKEENKQLIADVLDVQKDAIQIQSDMQDALNTVNKLRKHNS
jgi:uncharacterized protein (UPF0335 family)